jgi:hypothetical protein
MSELTHDQIERLKEIFITRKECETQMNGVDQKLNADSVRLAVIEHQLKNITWILCTVGGGIITIIIKLFMGG